MKVEHNKNSWRFIQSAVKTYVSLGRNIGKSMQKLRPDKRFLSWPHMPKRQIDALVGYDWHPKIEISVLEKFVSRHEGKKTSSGIDRNLVGRSFDDFSVLEMKRAVEIERMVSLIKVTLAEMKTIAAINGSHHKG